MNIKTNPFYQSYITDGEYYGYENVNIAAWIVATHKFILDCKACIDHDTFYYIGEELETIYYDDGATPEELDEFYNYLTDILTNMKE